MRCAWKFHPFESKCVCSSYCFYVDLTIYKFCSTKRIITVTTIVEGLTDKVLRQWKGLQTRCSNTIMDKDSMLPFVSIKSLQFCTWNCVSIFSYATAYAAKFFIISCIRILCFRNEPSSKYNDPTHHHFHHKIMSIITESNISKQTFQKWQDEVIACFNEKNWLDITIKKVGQGSSKRYVDSRSIDKIIDKQGDVIRRMHETIVNSSKDINIMSTEMGGMAQDLQKNGVEMKHYVTKLHQVDKQVEVSFILLCFCLCYRTFFCSWIRILCFYLEA